MSDGVPAAQGLGVAQVLRLRDFRLLWLGQAISDFGDSLTALALLILVNRLTGSTLALGGMLIVLAIPQLTFGLIAGVYVDRLDRRRIMLASDLLRGLMVLGFALVTSADHLWWLYLVGFAQATIGTFFRPARAALVPNLVPAEGLLAANSVGEISRIIAGLLGTAAAGVLISVLGVAWPAFVIDALTFFMSFAFVSRVAAPPRSAPAGDGSARAVLGQLFAGFGEIFHSRLLTGTLTGVAMAMLGLGAVNVLLVPLVVNDLRLPETWFAALEFAQTASMILSGGLVAFLAARLRPTRMVSVGLFLLGGVIALISQVRDVWQFCAILFAVGWIMTPLNSSSMTILQTAVRNEMRGRIGAAMNTLTTSANLLSMALAGMLGDALGVRMVFVVGGACVAIAGLASAWLFRGTATAARQEPEALTT